MPYAAGSVRVIPVHAMKLCGLTWTGECLWFSDAVLNQIMAVDITTGHVQQRIPCPDVRTDLTTSGGNLIQIAGDQRVLRVIDPATGNIIADLPNPRPGHLLCGLEATRHGLWLGYEDLKLIDLRNAGDLDLVECYPVRHAVAGVTVSDGYLFYADYRGGSINLLDLAQRTEVASISVDGSPTGVAWDGSRIWYCDYATFQLRAIEVPGITGA
jgi:hypothetical protein